MCEEDIYTKDITAISAIKNSQIELITAGEELVVKAF